MNPNTLLPKTALRRLLAAACVLPWLGAAAQAQVIAIDQAKALAGGITPGDAPGFPVTISRPGHYRLAGPLKLDDPNQTAIQIANEVGPVVVDLNGFALTGARCAETRCYVGRFDGSGVIGGRDVTVMNGLITNFGHRGLHIAGNGVLSNLQVTSNGDCGAVVNGRSLVRDAVFADNLYCGLWVTNGVIRSSLVMRNGSFQVYTAGPSMASGSSFLGPGTKGSLVSGGDNLCSASLSTGSGERC